MVGLVYSTCIGEVPCEASGRYKHAVSWIEGKAWWHIARSKNKNRLLDFLRLENHQPLTQGMRFGQDLETCFGQLGLSVGYRGKVEIWIV